MFTKKRALGLFALVLSTLLLTGCGGSGTAPASNDLLVCNTPLIPDSTGTQCVAPPPIECEAPLVPNEAGDQCVVGADPTLPPPVFFPAADQAVLYYNRGAVDADNSSNDPAYEGWRLHTWSNDACDAYADPDTDWAAGRIHDGVDPNYGAYWILDLKPGYAGTEGSCHNFIIHIGTDDAGKEMGGADFRGPLDQEGDFARMNFTLSGVPTVFEFPLLGLGPQPVSIEGQGAHWLDANTLLWDTDAASVKLHYSASADLEATLEEGLNGTAVELTEVTLTDEQIAIAPHLAGLRAFQGEWTADDAKAVLKTQAVLAAYNAEGTLTAATGIQLANGIDQLYTTGENDADEATLGTQYTDTGIITSVWAPTAQNVNLLIFNNDKTLAQTIQMVEDNTSGVWSYNASMDLDRALYRYEVTVYHPITGNIEVLEVTDPYSVAVSTNGRFSRFVNLDDEDLKPEGWDTHTIPTITNWEDAVIYEGHIRDFSVRDETVSEANRGKFLAFTEEGSAPVEHLRTLAEAGLTHFHVLPANDIATIEEDVSRTVDFDSTVGELCLLNRNAAVCDEEDPSATLGSVFASYDPLGEASKAQELANDMRAHDQFNWGYDPHHFNVPEGSYASDPEGVARIREMRAMVQGLHDVGLRVALDVVYNHTNASGVFPKSVLDKVVPGYYHRYEVDTGSIVRETCCDDTEPRNVMMEKFMHDSLLVWTQQYKFDAFRFDIMSQASKDTMVRLWDAVRAVDPDNYFYGEGWTRVDRGYEQANQLNMAGTQIGTFNDRIREAIRQGEFFKREADGGTLSAQDRIKISLAGTLTDFVLETSSGTVSTGANLGGYAADPADIINYVSKHDNETLWDQFNYVLPADLTLAERVRAQNIGLNLTTLAQGIPFLQMGGDMLRSKSMDRNTYDAGDWFNYVDFSMNTNNWNVGLPLAQDNQGRWAEMGAFIYAPERAASMTEIEFSHEVFKEFLSIRQGSPLFRLTTGQDIMDRVGFHNIGSRQQEGLILMSIDDGITPDSDVMLSDMDASYDAIVVAVNGGYEERSITVNTATGFELHMTQMNSYDPVVRNAYFTEGEGDTEGNGTFTIPAQTIAVFVKPQMGEQGYGLSAYATAGAPDVVPYGDTVVYLRGGMNGWGTDNPMGYKGDGVYAVEINLEEGVTHEFKVASEDWAAVNLGAPDGADNVVVEGEETLLATSNNNLSFTADTTTSYKFSLDANDTAEPLLIVSKADAYFDNPVYLRGGMNGWGTDNPFEFQGEGVYETAIDMEAGTYEFKVATDDWATVNLGAVSGADEDRRVELGQDKPLATTNDNLYIEVLDAEPYLFQWDNSDVAEPVIRVFKQQFFGTTPVYLRGGMNGWGTDNELSFTDGDYTVDIELSPGLVEFKVASEDWSAVNLGAPDGADNTVTLGTPITVAPSNNNLRLDVPAAGLYEFKVEGPNPASPTVTVTEK
ncbi:alpha-1,6-glucosidase domain-containing protein [Aestuariibacter salexigens]|uniref:alpha-1,6-glucosidase domain-containing protein n=1 Tax=Aestuariibacter salexigens TaxID=226010 RepID=UPI00047DD85A|nr:alpha-1,6-glucosidase domain-containing protein [Aestuariibacter salexigens]